MKLRVPFGTRPEVIKLAPVVAELRRRGHAVRAVATGQHADPDMSTAFHRDLGLEPDDTWALPDGDAARVRHGAAGDG